ncbi:hypothetical protein ACFFJB_05680 [Camelimonas abortus]|uniref:Uncharacterized protein n=1 Tax=Camelimonas abortus TaxID=1017184 RepID=A0ABV7LBA9_9HYPH
MQMNVLISQIRGKKRAAFPFWRKFDVLCDGLARMGADIPDVPSASGEVYAAWPDSSGKLSAARS